MRAPRSSPALLTSPVERKHTGTPKSTKDRYKQPPHHDTRGTPKQYISPRPTSRALSYEQMVKERKFAAHSNPNQKAAAKVKLCVSDKVAVVPSVINLESMELPAGNSSDFLQAASERSQCILDSFQWGDEVP